MTPSAIIITITIAIILITTMTMFIFFVISKRRQNKQIVDYAREHIADASAARQDWQILYDVYAYDPKFIRINKHRLLAMIEYGYKIASFTDDTRRIDDVHKIVNESPITIEQALHPRETPQLRDVLELTEYPLTPMSRSHWHERRAQIEQKVARIGDIEVDLDVYAIPPRPAAEIREAARKAQEAADQELEAIEQSSRSTYIPPPNAIIFRRIKRIDDSLAELRKSLANVFASLSDNERAQVVRPIIKTRKAEWRRDGFVAAMIHDGMRSDS